MKSEKVLCPKCKKDDNVQMNPLEAYCLTCQRYFNKMMNHVYKNRIDWDKLVKIWQETR